MTNSEAFRLNLDYYRKEAKALLKAAQAGEPAALERLSRQLTKSEPAAPKLHDAQLAVAREQGFPSWPRFRTFVIESGLDDRSIVAAFIDAAVSDLRRAEEILTAHPEIAGAGFYAALVLGNWKRVERALQQTPALATGRRGPQNCEALLYVCFSRFAGGKSSRADDMAETARVLLRHGADPNAFLTPDDLPGNPLSCLYAATGLNNNPALGLALLEAGATPNDNESLYHSTEHAGLACMKLLLRHGATPNGTNALRHMLDREDLEGVQLLLAAGADPNELNDRGETALHGAVWRGRSAAVVSALLDGGANLDARRVDGRTAYALAVQSGQTGIVQLLQERGASTDVPPVASGDERLLPDLAMNHHTQAVRSLLASGAPVNARGDMGATALHWACWKGYADLVELLLSYGASLTIEDEQFHGTPPGWFGHGVQNCGEPGGDYPGVARLLMAAGANFQSADLPALRERGLI